MSPTPVLEDHPAVFSDDILETIRIALEATPTGRLLDPFAGIGRIHDLRAHGWDTVGVELEPEWAKAHPGTIVGDSRQLPFDDATFDAVATSPAYGNRMADQYDGRDGSKRRTYRISLGRPLTDGNGAGLQWGSDYRTLHADVWEETVRVLRPGGVFVLNCKDHYRSGLLQRVTDWHIRTLHRLGAIPTQQWFVPASGFGFGANGQLRDGFEYVVRFVKPN